jgi:hypothetical protein
VKSGRMADPRTARVVDLKADITSTRVRSTTCSSWSASSSMPSATRNGSASVGHAHHGCPRGCAGLLQASFDGVFLVADRPSLIEGAGKLQPTLVVADLALAESERLYSGGSRTMVDSLVSFVRRPPRCRSREPESWMSTFESTARRLASSCTN